MTWHADHSTLARLDQWLGSAAASTPSLGKPLDIHIDEISDRLSERSVWIAGGLELLRAASQSSRLYGVEGAVYLIFHLNPDGETEVVEVDDPETQWAPLLHTMTPPELHFVHTRDREQLVNYLQEFGKEIGTLSVGGAQSAVYVTDRRDHYGDEVERVRHIWVAAAKSPVGR